MDALAEVEDSCCSTLLAEPSTATMTVTCYCVKNDYLPDDFD